MSDITDYIKKNANILKNDFALYDITEGNILYYLKLLLSAQLSGKKSKQAMQRAVPINMFNKILDKLSKLYSKQPTRTTDDPTNQKLIDYYVQEKDVDLVFKDANFNFNAYKKANIEICEGDDLDNPLFFNSLAGHEYLPLNTNKKNKTQLNKMIKIFTKDDNGDVMSDYKAFVYTDETFVVTNKNGDILIDEMLPDGENGFGIIPFAYIGRSSNLLLPKPDSDTFDMIMFPPVCLTDMSYGHMYQQHPIIYGIDINMDNMEFNPNTFLNIKSEGIDGEGARTPKFDVLRPEPNIEASIKMIISVISLWLETRNIKPGAIGNIDGSTNVSSALALIVQEADTTEDRNDQMIHFRKLEGDFWYRLAVIHNNFVDMGKIIGLPRFNNPEDMKVNVEYQEMAPAETKSEMVTRLKMEIDAGLNDVEGALDEYRPGLDEKTKQRILENKSMANKILQLTELNKNNQNNQNNQDNNRDDSNGVAEDNI